MSLRESLKIRKILKETAERKVTNVLNQKPEWDHVG